MDLEDFDPVQFARDTDFYFPVKSSWSPERSIDGIDPVCRTDHNNLTSFFQTVHHGQKLGNNPALHFTRNFLTTGGNGIELINENYRGGILTCFLKDFTETLLTLTVIF
jgi:hypothetical protein